MTWGASLMRLPDGLTIGEMSVKFGDDWNLAPVGSVADIGDALKSLFPDARHWDDECVVESEYAYVQFNFKDRTGNGTVEAIGIVSNGEEDSIAVIKSVCERFELRMFDHQTGEIADFDSEPKRSMEEYRAFCDRARKQNQQDE